MADYDRSAVSEELVTELLIPTEHATLERLWQLYRHDLSEFRDSHPDPEGSFARRRLEPVLGHDPDRVAYLFRRDGRPLGFALVGGLKTDPLRIDEFFVVRSIRRTGGCVETAPRPLARRLSERESDRCALLAKPCC